MRGFKTMYDYRGKVAGGIAAAVFAVVTLVQKLTHFTLFKKLNADQHYYLCLCMVAMSLYTMAFSREKNDDERVKEVRARSLQITFMLFAGVLLALSFNGIIFPDLQFDGTALLFLSGFYVVFYLVIFHIGIYFDNVWQFGEEPGIWQNLKKNKLMIVLIWIGSLILIELIFKLF